MLRALWFVPWIGVLVVLVVEMRFLCDDAFIAFRYARNWIEGHGLVFNVGEAVEGYSSLAWVLEVGALWAWLGIRPEVGAHVLSIGWTVATIAAVAWVASRSTAARVTAAWVAVGLLATSATFAAWSTGGLETRQFTALVFAGVWAFGTAGVRPGRLALGSALLGAAALTRPEALLVFGICAGVWATRAFVLHELDARRLAAALGPFALLVGAQLVFRQATYGEWLPNTYYAKSVRPWWEAGTRFVARGVLETGAWLLVPLAVVAAIVRFGTPRGRVHATALACIGAHALWVARLGGDVFAFRFFDFYWPLLAVAVADALVWIGRRPAIVAALGVVVIVHANALQGTLEWLVRDRATGAETARLCPTVTDENAPWLRWLVGMRTIAPIADRLRRENVERLVGLTVREHIVFGREREARWGPYERARRGVIPRDAVAATNAAGAMPFYLADLTVVDKLGLCDHTIARNPVEAPNAARLLAHDRRPPPGYLAARGVNIDPCPPVATEARALGLAPYAIPLGPDLWMPFRSTDAAWVERAFAAHGLVRRAPPAVVDATDGIRVDGGVITIEWSRPDDVGATYTVVASLGAGPTTIDGVVVPLAADAVSLASTDGWLSAACRDARGVVPADGRIRASIVLPREPLPDRLRIHVAALISRDGRLVDAVGDRAFTLRPAQAR